MQRSRVAIAIVLVAICLVVSSACNRSSSSSSLPKSFTNSIGMEFALVPAGEFRMGSPDSYAATDGSQPQHVVTLSSPFYVGIHEVTQAQFATLMEMHPSHFSAEGPGAYRVQGLQTDEFPVDRVTWEEAFEFCSRLSDLPEEKAAGRKYRLPNEAEWEYACRAGTITPFAYGEKISTELANINAAPSTEPPPLGRPAKVGSYSPNAFGLYDMHGNVWEWCAGGRREYTQEPQTNPQDEPDFYCALRGGAWDYPAEFARSDHRHEALAGYVYYGFRVVCEVE